MTRWRVMLLAVSLLATSGATLSAQDPVVRETEKASLLRFCQQTDLGAAATVQGAKDRTDCWKRMQLEGMGDAVVDAKYRRPWRTTIGQSLLTQSGSRPIQAPPRSTRRCSPSNAGSRREISTMPKVR